jgi:hypothetical protein
MKKLQSVSYLLTLITVFITACSHDTPPPNEHSPDMVLDWNMTIQKSTHGQLCRYFTFIGFAAICFGSYRNA